MVLRCSVLRVTVLIGTRRGGMIVRVQHTAKSKALTGVSLEAETKQEEGLLRMLSEVSPEFFKSTVLGDGSIFPVSLVLRMRLTQELYEV